MLNSFVTTPILLLGISLSLIEVSSAEARGAQPLPSSTEQALRETQTGLTDPSARAKLLKADPAAQAHDAKLKSMLGGQSENAYQLSSQLMETIVQKTGGDPAKMQALVNQLMSNPQMIEQYLTPTQRDQIRKMAGEIEAKKAHPPASGAGQ